MALTVVGTTGCYYTHLAGGQAKLLWARRSIDDVLADPATEAELRRTLELVQQARRYAFELGLEVDGQYTTFVDWPGDRIITSLVATEPGHVDARPFRFPIVGSVPYKGFFDRERAEREADELRSDGLDVCLLAIPAYSTLGWFNDPLTRPMLTGGNGRLVETVLHELVHATVFVKSQPEFNEGLASFVGQEASVHFFARQPGDDSAAEARRADIRDRRVLSRTLLEFREQVEQLYAEPVETRSTRGARRSALEAKAREQLAALDFARMNGPRLAERARLNDACIALQGTYAGDDERHQAVLEQLDGDLAGFILRAREAAEADDPRSAFFEFQPDGSSAR
jgi:predicted aminopeptidase